MIENAIKYVKQIFADDCSGHDDYHTMRVYRLAMQIAEQENADMLIVQLAALLHDVDVLSFHRKHTRQRKCSWIYEK